MLHSAVAILKLAEMEYSGASALFMRVLLLKKYALPYRVVDALVDYFTAFGVAPRGEEAPEMMPLLWHQCLLAFAQHYKAELTNEQKERFKMLLRVQEHGLVTPDIRRELFSGRSRGDPYLPPLAGGSRASLFSVCTLVSTPAPPQLSEKACATPITGRAHPASFARRKRFNASPLP